MEKENKRQLVVNLILFILLATAVVLLYYIFSMLKTDGVQCLNNPLIFGIQKLEQSNDADIQCSCTISKLNAGILKVDDEKMWIQPTDPISSSTPTNFSEIQKTFESRNEI